MEQPEQPPASFQHPRHRPPQPHRTCSVPSHSLSTQQTSRAPHQEMGTVAREALLSRTKALGSWEPESLRVSVPREIANL